jgi:hypothetical protein
VASGAPRSRPAARAGSVALALAGLASCALVADLPDYREVDSKDDASFGPEAAVARDANGQGGDSGPVNEAGADASIDAACASSTATSLLGTAKNLSGFIELTTEAVGRAGGIASPTTRDLNVFQVSFDYSITFNGSLPAAGLAFFALAAPLSGVACQPGASICALDAAVPGWAVLLRLAKGNSGDPDVPYLAVVDAESFPTVQPSSPLRVDPTKVWLDIGGAHPASPAAASWHQMSIFRSGPKVTVAIDGRPAHR